MGNLQGSFCNSKMTILDTWELYSSGSAVVMICTDSTKPQQHPLAVSVIGNRFLKEELYAGVGKYHHIQYLLGLYLQALIVPESLKHFRTNLSGSRNQNSKDIGRTSSGTPRHACEACFCTVHFVARLVSKDPTRPGGGSGNGQEWLVFRVGLVSRQSLVNAW